MKKSISLIVLILIFVAGMAWAETTEKKSAKEKVKEEEKKENWGVWAGKGIKAERAGNYDEAIKCYKKVMAIDPKSTLAHSLLGDAYFKKGMFDEAIAEYKKFLASTPDDLTIHYDLGRAYHANGMLDEAIAEYKKFIANKPKNSIKGVSKSIVEQINTELKASKVSAHFYLGLIYHEKGMLDKAISEYKKAIAIEPSYASAHNNLGIVYYKKGLNTLGADHFYKAGLLFLEQGDREKALNAYLGLKGTTKSKELERALFEKLYPELKQKKSEPSK